MNLDLTISPEDDMLHARNPAALPCYIEAGENALANIHKALALCSKSDVGTILDLPCGFGRVTRHVAAAFPESHIYACDLYQNRIDFCAKQFGAVPIKSREHFDDLTFDVGFDLIWCGSLLTHLKRPRI